MSPPPSSWPCALVLENGATFEGIGYGPKKNIGGEVVFNTGMSGYQEIFTDPSYAKQILVMTYPHLGNYGFNFEDNESNRFYLSGIVTRELCLSPSSWRSKHPLTKELEKQDVPLISEIDTRALTCTLRDEGAQRGVLFPYESDSNLKEQAETYLKQVPSMEGLELVSEVSCKKPYIFESEAGKPSARGTIVVYDFGVKHNILRHIRKRGFQVQVVPYNTPAPEALSYHPIAILLSNGPGDPASVKGAVEQISGLVGKTPIMAICMGHQILARTLGLNTYKLKFGHHGINHPVKDLRTNKILITSQNHGFAVDPKGFENRKEIEISHISLNDQTVEGFYSNSLKLYSVQFHPEAAPGPSDAGSLFDEFLKGFVQ